MTKAVNQTNEPKTTPKKKKKQQRTAKVSPAGAAGGVSAGRRILSCALRLEMTSGIQDAPRKQIAAMTGVKTNTFPVVLSGLKKKELIEYPDKDTIRLTAKGKAQADLADAPAADNESVQADLKKQFLGGGKAAQMFDILVDGRVHDRLAVASTVGITNKATLAVTLSNMKKNGIIEYDRTTVQLTDKCFPFGRPT